MSVNSPLPVASELKPVKGLRLGIHLRGYAQKDPKQEYRREAFELFARLLDVVKLDVTKTIMMVKIQTPEELEQASE